MNEREKLTDEIGCLIQAAAQDEGFIAEPVATDRLARYLVNHGVTPQNWIPISEGLPESLVFVVALTTGGDRIIARLDKYGWLRYGGYETERLRPITHWMPLPDPPKEEA